MADPIRELFSQVSYNGDGSTSVWNFNFAGGYLDKAHVKAQRLNKTTGAVDQIPVTSGMFIGNFQLQITPAIPVGFELTIYRDTPKDLPLVDFADQANLTEAALDLNAKQAIFVAAESADGLNVAIDSVSQIIDFVDNARTYSENATAQAAAAALSATSAADSALSASTSAGLAGGSATAAGNSATAAAGSASAAAGSATTATTQAGIATTQAGNASTSATNAGNSATAAGNSATAAASSATTANTRAGDANTSAIAAAGSATTASNQATAAGNSATAAAGSATAANNSAIAAAASAASIAGGPVASIDGLTGAVTSAQIRAATLGKNGTFTYRNLIINGDIIVNQRNVANTNVTAYIVDRWVSVITSLTATSAALGASGSGLGGSAGKLRTQSTAANSIVAASIAAFVHRIEANMLRDTLWGTANARPLTVSFWAKSSITGTFAAYVNNVSGGSTRSQVKTFTLTANTAKYVTLTFSGDTSGTWDAASNAAGMTVGICFTGGSSHNAPAADTWYSADYHNTAACTNIMTTNTSFFECGDIQAEVGDIATPFERRPYSAELVLCQRYYYKFQVGMRSPTQSVTWLSTTYNFANMRAAPAVGYGADTTPAFGNAQQEAIDVISASAVRYNVLSSGSGDTYALNRQLVAEADY